MKTIFETCTPRDEVLKGELREQQFAASLTKVLRGEADEVYGDPIKFFANTYATGVSLRPTRCQVEVGPSADDRFGVQASSSWTECLSTHSPARS